MSEKENLMFKVFTTKQKLVFGEPSLFLAKNIETQESCQIEIASELERLQIELKPLQSGMGFCHKGEFEVLCGQCQVSEIDLIKLAKLQVFIDRRPILKSFASCDNQLLFKAFLHNKDFVSFQDIESWFIGQVIKTDSFQLQIIDYVRSTEWYCLVSFLLTELDGIQNNITELSSKYGLSASYFRSLCRKVLGNSIKGEVNDWRLVSALIDMIRLDVSMTDIAYQKGYSSLSHFSTEVKEMVGVSPRNLMKIMYTK